MSLDRLTLKLTDFNLSRAESSNRNSIAGSLPWLAPEVIRGEKRHTRESDVYSFGIVVWELVSF
jgi:serine/threonine protein kinase